MLSRRKKPTGYGLLRAPILAGLASAYDLCVFGVTLFIAHAAQVKKKTPLLTLPQARRLLAAVLPVRSLSLEGVMEIIDYHLKRNLTARNSHRKKNVALALKLKAKVAL